jgi:hypothetical protein
VLASTASLPLSTGVAIPQTKFPKVLRLIPFNLSKTDAFCERGDTPKGPSMWDGDFPEDMRRLKARHAAQQSQARCCALGKAVPRTAKAAL